ncbi:MAG TPA: glucosaminidase domain-containing protein [Pseudomonadales bacterium]|nr:glucosaminidase domain-containing protein [Pseudomonadales bacterium]
MHWLMKAPIGVLVIVGVVTWGGAYSLFAQSTPEAPVAPPIIALPPGADTLPDFSEFPAGKARKEAFFQYLLPIIRHINSQLRAERFALDQLRKAALSSQGLSNAQLQELMAMSEKYGVEEESVEDQLAILWRRVDTIPASLALAQAANESAYGTSRFAVDANNLFGQWCFREGCGLVPNARIEEASHEVRKFNTPVDSVRSYMHNLNTNRAYASLRLMRSKQRSSKQPPTGMELVNALLKYSSRGQDYVDELSSMIRHNKLARFDVPSQIGQQKARQ